MDNKIAICLDNEYDTYIEELFFKKVKSDIKSKTTRNNIIAAWRLDKKIYTDYSGSISHEFLHYSLHDQSHSISILQYVYLLLGEDLLNNFSVSDLWIMLEVAYSHDIGMSATYEELKEIWNDKREVNNIIKKILKYSDREAMELYNIVKDKIENDLVDADNDFLNTYPHWQLEFRKAINYINSEYLRKNHPNKSRNIIDKVLLKLNTEHLNIEERFYKIIGNINYLHGEDFSEIENLLENEELGIETDIFHPRMIAMLLRIGDVLDIRNNRFNLRNKDYLGGLPKDSKEHFLKHKGVTNFLVTNENVRVHIKSDKLEVCKNSAYWLEYIENEYNNFTSHWNDYVSDNLKGLKLKNVDLKIEYNGKEFIAQDFSQYLKTDPKKLMQLMVGKNLYNTNLIMFREYLQNSIDASKVKLAMSYIDDEKFLERCKTNDFKKVTPDDFDLNDYMDLSIDIYFDYDEKSDLIAFSIADHGIGMDEDGLDALCNIGQGWNQRREIANRFDEFPDWLKPTGGFGIGTLSAFLLTDQVQFKTKSKNHPYYDIKINSPINGNDGAIEKMIIDTDEKISGTEVIFKIDFSKYYYEILKYFIKENIKINSDLLYANIGGKSIKEQFIQNSLFKFINDIIVNSFFYVKIFNKSSLFNESIDPAIIDMKYTYWNKQNERLVQYSMTENKREFGKLIDFIDYDVDDDFIYDDACIFGYKGIKVSKSNYRDIIDKQNYDLFLILGEVIESIDFYSDKVTDVLDVSRTSFASNFDLEKQARDILYECFVRYIFQSDYKNSIISNKMEMVYIYLYDEIKKINPKLIDTVKNQKNLFNKSFYYFTKDELLKYKVWKCINNILSPIDNLIYSPNTKIMDMHKGDGNMASTINILNDRLDELLNALLFYKDEELERKTKMVKESLNNVENQRNLLYEYEDFIQDYANKYMDGFKNYECSLSQVIGDDEINIDYLEYYERKLSPRLVKKLDSKKTLYYMGTDTYYIRKYKYFLNHYLKEYIFHEEKNLIRSKISLKKKTEDAIELKEIDLASLISNDLVDRNINIIYVIGYIENNFIININKYKDIVVTDYFKNIERSVVINPFTDITNIFNNDNSINELLKYGFNRQKIINSLNKNDNFKSFTNNIYKYKLASISSEEEKQEISKEKIKKQYVSLICDVLEIYSKRDR